MTPRPIRRLAIVNRGEPAMRCIRAVKALAAEGRRDIRAIALYTDGEREAPFARHADAAVRLPSPNGAVNAYLDHDNVLRALREARADAVWPGWGFVAEDASFVARLRDEGIVFLGPSAEAMRALGDKITSKELAERADVPVTAWSQGVVADERAAAVQAERIGYPIAVKASAGGGGRGIRMVDDAKALPEAFRSAAAEAKSAFGDGRLFLEKKVSGRAAHRGADRRRRPGQRRRARLPRLLGPAPAPEAHRGGAAARPRRRDDRGAPGLRHPPRRPRLLHGRRHGRVPPLGRGLLLPRGEPAPAGGARHHRGDHRRRPRAAADPHRRGRVDQGSAPRGARAWPSRRGSTRRIPIRASCPRPDASCASTRRSARGCGWIPASRRARSSRPTSTR